MIAKSQVCTINHCTHRGYQYLLIVGEICIIDSGDGWPGSSEGVL